MSESEESFKSVQKDEKLFEFAESLREQIEKDPKKAIDSSVICEHWSNQFMMRQ